MPTTGVSGHAIVLGGGLAGCLTAAVLAGHFQEVTLVERHLLPAGPEPRQGAPHARHAHLLWSSGARTIESLLPGTLGKLAAAGAHRIGVPNGTVILTTEGWMRRWPEIQFMITASKDLFDWVVRDQALTNRNIAVLESAEAVRLLGDASRVTGVEIHDHGAGQIVELGADLVVDATGRGSAAHRWLAELGVGEVEVRSVDSSLTYASRIYRAPAAPADGWPVINVQADPHSGEPGQTSGILPIEQGRWIVTLSSTRGAEPPGDPDGFVRFAREVRHPIVGDLIAKSEPLTDIVRTHSTVNRRRYFERLRQWPDGFVVIGDAVATYNPIYGHGMSVVANSVAVIREHLDRDGLATGATRRIQQAVARVVQPAWATATTQDVLYPGTTGLRPTVVSRTVQRYLERVTRAAITRPTAARALINAFTLSAPMTDILRPKVMLTALSGATGGAPAEPPFVPSEQAVIDDLLG